MEIFQQPDGWIMIRGYNPAIVEYILRAIPKNERRWFPKEKCWRINGIYLDQIKKIFYIFVHDMPIIHDIPISEAYNILSLHPGATLKEIKHKYRVLALKYHPDRYNGRSNMMILLNWAYNVLVKSTIVD